MTESERRALCIIGAHKEEIRNAVNNGWLNNEGGLIFIERCIRVIRMYKRIAQAAHENESPIEQFNQYVRPWDYDNGELPEEEGAFYQFGEPTAEYKSKMKEKARHQKHRMNK